MYYLVYGFLYLVSLLPFFIIYRISDLFFLMMYHVFGYRKKVVMYNLAIAFPEKSIVERKEIARKFYLSLIDTFMETVKMLSMSERKFYKYCKMDFTAIHQLEAAGKSIQFHSGHQMNWEYINWVMAKNLTIPWIGIYQPISNQPINKIFYNLRAKYGTKLVSTREFKQVMHELFRNQFSIGLAADQNTSPATGYWQYFFSKPAPFIMGPEKGAIKNETAVVFVKMVKIKRGHYEYIAHAVTENAADMPLGKLTRIYRDFLEATIREQPENYLWTHRRWRHEYNIEHAERWIDTRPKP